ncbi:hypothetical protein HPB58_12895 [Priestia filamentosa]|uniref:hypothetical protein n=1 Tax=Priestia filamentosa TaxID=1402861 RepID=UPI001FB4AC45|nr:hypothetical protein [Priestia filamentosa]UOE58254.1 hypothetical protein HPB58_12895 [Priestia filamentosa]
MKKYTLIGIVIVLAAGIIGFIQYNSSFATNINGEWKSAKHDSVIFKYSRKGDTLTITNTSRTGIVKLTYNITEEDRNAMHTEFVSMSIKNPSGEEIDLSESQKDAIKKEDKERGGLRIISINKNKIASVRGDAPSDYKPIEDEISIRK